MVYLFRHRQFTKYKDKDIRRFQIECFNSQTAQHYGDLAKAVSFSFELNLHEIADL